MNNKNITYKNVSIEEIIQRIKNNSINFNDLSYELKNNKEIVLACINQDAYTLSCVSEQLKDDKDVVLAAIKINPYLITYASKKLTNDKEVILETVKNYGEMLSYASDRLKDNRDVVLAACKNSVVSLAYASKRFAEDQFFLELLEKQDKNNFSDMYHDWYDEKIEFLNNMRRKEDKAIIESNIVVSNKVNKKNKF